MLKLQPDGRLTTKHPSLVQNKSLKRSLKNSGLFFLNYHLNLSAIPAAARIFRVACCYPAKRYTAILLSFHPPPSNLNNLWTKTILVNLRLSIGLNSATFMEKTIFEISKMDCPSEEALIRMKLDGISDIKKMSFDIPQRSLTIIHSGSIDEIEKSILELNLGGRKISTEETELQEFENEESQRRVLWIVLLINFGFFLIEMATGLFSKSMGLVADSLDMLADSFVYGISLFAVGGTVLRKKRVAKLAGIFQLILAATGFAEVLRRFLGAEIMPDYATMIYVSIATLLANGLCLYLLQKSKSKEEAHMKASLIFTSNDIIINLGVISAGLLVNWLNSGTPDLIIGTIVFLLVIQGALRILKLAK